MVAAVRLGMRAGLGLLALTVAAIELGLVDLVRTSLPPLRWQLDELLLIAGALCFAGLAARHAKRHRMAVPGLDDATLVADLRAAIAGNALEVHYQPKMDARTNRIVSLEALVRWNHPLLGAISPGRFVPLAEASGDMPALTMRVLAHACRDAAFFRANAFDQTVFVNISALLVSDDAFTTAIIEAIATSQANIGIEVTETAVIDAPERALANLRRLADAGLPIAIDDYGVGLSSLTYLRQMPASELKIDMSFIRDLTNSHRDPLIVRSTVDLAHGLGMKVTAEGVDKPETLALLRIMGCDYIQGYQIAPALSRDAALSFMQNDGAADDELPEFAAALLRLKGSRAAP
jgi:EAL domain-containing protein (putative c-di-GMP-specific phosphodiesterase class I)